jgi:RhtB (resistance to homoserine/threonine) family protein
MAVTELQSYVPLLATLFVVDMLAAMSPGPNFLLVTQTAIRRTSRAAGAVVVGLIAANLAWCAAVILGLTVVFQAVPWLYGALKVAGGAYLIYLGVSMWRSRGEAAAAPGSAIGSLRGAFVRGFVTNLTNPKSAVYFGSIFALFLSPGTPVTIQAVAIGIVLVDTVVWYGAVAVLFSRPAVQRVYDAARGPIDRVAGSVMGAFGARLVLVRE